MPCTPRERGEVDRAACRRASRSAPAGRPAGGTRRCRRRRCRRRRTWRRCRGRPRRADRWRRAGSTGRRAGRPSDRRTPAAMPSDGRHEAVDAVGPAVGEDATPSARRGEALDVAHGHARRDHERRAVGQRGARRRARRGPRTARPSRRPARRSRRVPTRRRRCHDSRHSRRRPIPPTASASAPSSSSGVGDHAAAHRVVRVEPRTVGIDQDLVDRRRRATASRLAGERRADAQHDVGPVRRRRTPGPRSSGS